MKTKLFAILVVVICWMVLWPVLAKAALITIEIEAVVDSVTDDGNFLEGKISPGDTITGWYIYDTSTPDSSSLPTVGDYWHYAIPSGVSLAVGDFEFKTDPDNVRFMVEIVNDHSVAKWDNYLIYSYNNLPLPNGTLVYGISWQLDDPTGQALSTTELPTTAPILDDWQSIYGLRLLGGPGGHGPSFSIWAHVTSAVPEPASIILLGLGGLLIRKRQ